MSPMSIKYLNSDFKLIIFLILTPKIDTRVNKPIIPVSTRVSMNQLVLPVSKL